MSVHRTVSWAIVLVTAFLAAPAGASAGWSNSTTVASLSDQYASPKVVANAHGDALATWVDGTNLRVVERTAGAWAAPRTVATVSADSPVAADVAPDGSAVIAWRGATDPYTGIGQVKVVRRTPAGTWGSASTSPVTARVSPRLTVHIGSAGTVDVVSCPDPSLDDCRNGQIGTQSSAGSWSGPASVGTALGGYPGEVLFEATRGDDLVLAAAVTGRIAIRHGGGWTSVQAPARQPDSRTAPLFAATTSGAMWTLYTDLASGRFMSARRDALVDWSSSPFDIPVTIRSTYQRHLAVADDERAVFVQGDNVMSAGTDQNWRFGTLGSAAWTPISPQDPYVGSSSDEDGMLLVQAYRCVCSSTAENWQSALVVRSRTGEWRAIPAPPGLPAAGNNIHATPRATAYGNHSVLLSWFEGGWAESAPRVLRSAVYTWTGNEPVLFDEAALPFATSLVPPPPAPGPSIVPPAPVTDTRPVADPPPAPADPQPPVTTDPARTTDGGDDPDEEPSALRFVAATGELERARCTSSTGVRVGRTRWCFQIRAVARVGDEAGAGAPRIGIAIATSGSGGVRSLSARSTTDRAGRAVVLIPVTVPASRRTSLRMAAAWIVAHHGSLAFSTPNPSSWVAAPIRRARIMGLAR